MRYFFRLTFLIVILIFFFTSCVSKKKFLQLESEKAVVMKLLAEAKENIKELENEKTDCNEARRLELEKFYNGIPVMPYPFKKTSNVHSIHINQANGMLLSLAINKIGHHLCNDNDKGIPLRYFVIKSIDNKFNGFVIATPPEIIDDKGRHIRFVSEQIDIIDLINEKFKVKILNEHQKIRGQIFVLQTKRLNFNTGTSSEMPTYDAGGTSFVLPETDSCQPIQKGTCYVYCTGAGSECFSGDYAAKIGNILK